MKKKIVFITLSLEGGGAEKILSRLVVNLHNEFDIVLVTFYRKADILKSYCHSPDWSIIVSMQNTETLYRLRSGSGG
jgi:hypothetical protein